MLVDGGGHLQWRWRRPSVPPAVVEGPRRRRALARSPSAAPLPCAATAPGTSRSTVAAPIPWILCVASIQWRAGFAPSPASSEPPTIFLAGSDVEGADEVL